MLTIKVEITSASARDFIALHEDGEAKSLLVPGIFSVEFGVERPGITPGAVGTQFVFYKDGDRRIRLSRSSEGVLIQDSPAVKARISDIILQLDEKPQHPEGRVCGDCLKFDRVAGRDELLRVTHVFDGDLVGHGNLEAIQAMAVAAKSVALSKDNVGFCAPYEQLCADCTAACTEWFKPRGQK